MSIFNRNNLMNRQRSLGVHFANSLSDLKAMHRRGMRLLWEVEGDVTPQKILDGFGSEAATLFQKSGELVAFIKTQDPDWSPMNAPFEFTINGDGTVTVGDRIPITQNSPEE